MPISQPVYTLTNECQDCYKCIRECPVKAIKVEKGHAFVMQDKCISCGNCVIVCPCNAKRVRSDVGIATELLESSKKVYASLAPSWRGAFDCTETEIISSLKKLGFTGVSETALGAQEVSIKTAEILNKAENGFFISSACPVVVEYIRKYRPEFVKNIVPIASPALTHAKMLKEMYGEDISVIFIGPCIGKKNESDTNKNLIDVSLTFEELKLMFEKSFINIHKEINLEEIKFLPHNANEGNFYPIDGGMNRTLKQIGVKNCILTEFASLKSFKKALDGFKPNDCTKVTFAEVLACEGGCIGGPCISTEKSEIMLISDILTRTKLRDSIPKEPLSVVHMDYAPKKEDLKEYSLEEINEALKKLGKSNPEDELNCGGCGYNTCRELALALIAGIAEPSMCVSYMRKLAMQKASIMIRCMPSSVVIVDSFLRILEANTSFIRAFTGDMADIFEADGIAGASLDRIVDIVEIFKEVFKLGHEIHKEHYCLDDKIYDIIAFVLEPGKVAGAIITDVTKTQMNREKIARRANEVISKNISIVQEIACLLGEHMVETETLLSSIADDYDK